MGTTMSEQPQEQLRLHVRWMVKRDMQEVLDIENTKFPDGWNEQNFLKVLAMRNVIGMVCEDGEAVLGFMVYALEKQKILMLNFGVNQSHWHTGVLTAMFDRLKSKISKHRRPVAEVHANEYSDQMHLFLKRNGFRAVEVRRAAACDGADIYVFQYEVRPAREEERDVALQDE